MTAHNLKTLMSVSAFQSEWDQKMIGYTMVDPKSIVPVSYKTRMECSIAEFSFVYVDNFKHVFLPVLRFDFDLKCFDYYQQGDQLKMLTSMMIKGNFNNSRTAKWEPFLESLVLDAEIIRVPYKTTIHVAGGAEGTPEGIYLNFSEELLEVILHCVNNASSVMSVAPSNVPPVPFNLDHKTTSVMTVTMESRLSEGTEEEDMIIYDSQFLIRNKTGLDIFIQTLGDRRGDTIKVRNMSEKVVNFIILDEFSTKDNVNRDVILNFGPDIKQGKLP